MGPSSVSLSSGDIPLSQELSLALFPASPCRKAAVGMKMSGRQQPLCPGSLHGTCTPAQCERHSGPVTASTLQKPLKERHEQPQSPGEGWIKPRAQPGLCPRAASSQCDGRAHKPLSSCLMLSPSGLCHLLPCLCHLSLPAARRCWMLSGNFPLCQVLNTYQANAASLEVCTRDNMLP